MHAPAGRARGRTHTVVYPAAVDHRTDATVGCTRRRFGHRRRRFLVRGPARVRRPRRRRLARRCRAGEPLAPRRRWRLSTASREARVNRVGLPAVSDDRAQVGWPSVSSTYSSRRTGARCPAAGGRGGLSRRTGAVDGGPTRRVALVRRDRIASASVRQGSRLRPPAFLDDHLHGGRAHAGVAINASRMTRSARRHGPCRTGRRWSGVAVVSDRAG